MSLFKRLAGAIDPSIVSFTKVLQRRRGLQIGPGGSAQGLLYRIGADSAGNAMSPEATLARILKEWSKLQGMPVDDQVSLLEWRVFSKNFWSGYPDFASVDEWFLWRLQVAFPEHSISARDGWTPDFFGWAKERAIETFA